MSYAERLYFTAEPVAHVAAFEEAQRLRMIHRRNRAALASFERRTGGRAGRLAA